MEYAWQADIEEGLSQYSHSVNRLMEAVGCRIAAEIEPEEG